MVNVLVVLVIKFSTICSVPGWNLNGLQIWILTFLLILLDKIAQVLLNQMQAIGEPGRGFSDRIEVFALTWSTGPLYHMYCRFLVLSNPSVDLAAPGSWVRSQHWVTVEFCMLFPCPSGFPIGSPGSSDFPKTSRQVD